MIVPDASILANAVADDGPDGERARSALEPHPDAALPDLADVEVLSVLRRHVRLGTISEARAAVALQSLIALPFPRFPALPFLERAFELRHNVTPYDAMYVALAEVLGCELLTVDERLARAPGLRCPVRVLTA